MEATVRPPARRVRTVRLRAPSAELIRRGTLLLEDALHVASLPESGTERLLIIRSLAIGRIRRGQSSAQLALTVESKIRQAGLTAVHADDPVAGSRDAVYFNDHLEPYRSLTRRLVAGEDAAAWFWPLAVPGYRPGLPRRDALRMAFLEITQQGIGPVAVALLVAELVDRGLADPLLAVVEEMDAAELFRAAGWQRSSLGLAPGLRGEPTKEATPRLAGRWLDLLDRWIAQWGPADARSTWLAATALIAERPSRALDSRLIARAESLVDAMQERRLVAGDPVLGRPRPVSPPARLDGYGAEASPTGDSDDVGGAAKPLVHSLPASGAEHVEDAPSEPATPITMLTTGTQATQHGGFYFLLPILVRLGLPDWLAADPELLELDFAQHLLTHAARRLRILASDPVRLPLRPTAAAPERIAFRVPTFWRRGIARPGSRLGPAGDRFTRSRVLYDGSGQLALALWQGRARADVRQLLDSGPLARTARIDPRPPFAILLDAWWRAADRWCRQYAGLTPRELVRRPGRIAISRTHLDVSFDLRQADIRVRRAGLDLDPGWLPWFGHVVTFHYAEGERE